MAADQPLLIGKENSASNVTTLRSSVNGLIIDVAGGTGFHAKSHGHGVLAEGFGPGVEARGAEGVLVTAIDTPLRKAGDGVAGETPTRERSGVVGRNTAEFDFAGQKGGNGVAGSGSGAGVVGFGTGTLGNGVVGHGSGSGNGVFGRSVDGVGVVGASQHNLAGEFKGRVQATDFVKTSDERLKTNIQQLGATLNKLEYVRGVAFDWSESPQALGTVARQTGIGVIAQEVEEVFPELVADGGDHDHKAVDYCGLASVLVEAVKELKEENEALRSRIEALEQA